MKKIPNTEKTFQDFLTSYNEKMQFDGLNFNEFEEAFKSLKRNKAANQDDVSSNIITDAYDSLKNVLFHVSKSFRKNCVSNHLEFTSSRF